MSLNQLASQCVGDGKTDLIFVTRNSEVVAVFVGEDYRRLAVDMAMRDSSLLVEDKSGVAFPNN